MKTKEQIKTEVMNYLEKTTKHLFLISGSEHRIILHGDYVIRVTGEDVSVQSIDYIINCYVSNAKCVIKHSLFLTPRYYNREIKSIPYYKAAKEFTNKIIESIKDKNNQSEIRNIVKGLV